MSPGNPGAAAAGAGPQGWLERRGATARFGIAMLAGASLTLAQPPVSQPAVLFLGLPVLVWLTAAAPSPRAAALLGWAAGFGGFVSGLHWMGHAFLVDPDRFLWLLPFAVTGLPAFLGLFWAAGFALARWLAPPAPWARALALAGAVAAAEYARSVVLTGLPWGLAAYAWVETPILQAAAWTGPHGLTLLTLAVAAVPLAAGLRHPAAWAALGLLGLGWALGLARLAGGPVMPTDAAVVRIVQPNAEQHLKWLPEWRALYAARLVEGSAAPADPHLGPPDLVIWPETAITFLPQDAPEQVAAIAASARGATLVTGALFHEPGAAGRRWFNALMAVAPDGTIVARYDKHHLVPFGEYLPLRGLLARLGLDALAGMPGGGFVPGPGPRTVMLPGLPAFSPLVCYEMIFPGGVVAPGARPEFLLHVTNDAWFGRLAGPQQHLAQARARAVEQGLPVARAAQTGISAVIDAHGRVLAALPLGTHGTLDAALPAPLPPTAYARTGDGPALAALAALLGLLAAHRLARRRPDRADRAA